LPGAAAAALTCDARDVVGFETRGPVRAVRLGRESAIEARAVLVATGVSYRLLGAPGLGEFTGRGVFYGATASDAQSCAGDDVHVVGAANSAGQAVLNMARFARRVVLLVRSAALENSMSQYLVERIRDAGNIEVRLQAEVVAGRGDDHLQAVTVADRAAGAKEEQPTNWLFIFIGASPRTDWLGPDVARDENGFVITGQDLLTRKDGPHWSLTRPPFVLEMPLIEASPGELNQVWTNIIDNAVDAMDAHGTLRISTRATPEDVVVEIGDTGPGMPPDVQARAFEAFYTTKDVGKGTGLGLDISRRIIVERHHGQITIDSRPGETVLRIHLPRRRTKHH